MHPGGRLRFVGFRAAVVGGVATLVGVLGHVRAGGESPSIALLCGLWLLCTASSVLFLLRQATWLRLALLLLVEQVLVHSALMVAAMRSTPAMPDMPSMASMPAPPGMADDSMPAMSATPSPEMVLMHALAAAVVALWLWRGECALARLLAVARDSIALLWPTVLVSPVVDGQRSPLLPNVGRASWGLLCAQTVRRRGPPLALAS